MFLGMSSPPPWTSQLVADRLVTAFRRVPTCPVLSTARGFSIGGQEVEPFGWPERFVVSRRDRNMLMTWARCRATGERMAPIYREFEWNADQVDYRRRVALAAIVRGLNHEARCNEGLTIPEVTPELVPQADLLCLE